MDCHAFIKARPLCAPHGDDNLNKLCNDRKKSVITSGSEVVHIQKFVNFLNNNVAFPKNAKKYNNNVASAHCVNNSEGRKIVKARKGLKPLVISINNSDNLSRSNPCFVINNFNLIKEDIRMRISKTKKFLTIILSISLLFAVSCGDKPTGSTTDGTIPSEHNGKTYKQDTTASPSSRIFWLQIKDGEIYREEGKNDSKPTEFTTKIRDMIPNVKITIEGNTYIYDWGTSTITFKFAEDWNSVVMTDAGGGSSSTYNFKIHNE